MVYGRTTFSLILVLRSARVGHFLESICMTSSIMRFSIFFLVSNRSFTFIFW